MQNIIVNGNTGLGCSIVSIPFFQSLKNSLPDIKIILYTKFPDLLQGAQGIDEIYNIKNNNLSIFDVNLEDYLKSRPHNSEPFKPLSYHLIRYGQSQLNK